MDTIKRTISLEPSRSRIEGTIYSAIVKADMEDGFPSSDVYVDHTVSENGSNYGRFPYDVIVSGSTVAWDSLKDSIPLVTHRGKSNVLRYRTMMSLYYAICEAVRGYKTYERCIRKGTEYWRETTPSENRKENFCMYLKNYGGYVSDGELPDIDTTDYSVWCICPEWDYISKSLSYSDDSGNIVYQICEFYDFVKILIYDKHKSIRSYSEPYLNVSVFLSNDIDSLGELYTCCEEWEEGKSYGIGDYVTYSEDGNISDVYRLKSCIGGSVVVSEITGNILNYLRDNSINKVVVPYNFNRIETSTLSGNTTVEEMVIQNIGESRVLNASGLGKSFYAYGYIDGIKRYFMLTPSYSGYVDPDTQEVKFDNSTYSHWEKMEYDEYYAKKSDSEYQKWAASNTESSDTYTYRTESYLQTLKRDRKSYSFYGEELPFYYSNSGVVSLEYEEGSIHNRVTSNGVSYYDYLDSIETDDGTITFTYHMGVIYSGDTCINAGIEHKETYEYSTNEYTFYADDSGSTNPTVTVEYTNIDYDSLLVTPNTDIEESRGSVIVSDIDFDTSGSEDFSTVYNVFRQESLLGLEGVKVSSDTEIQIDRGKAAAFERHHILSEVDTFNDLAKYRNNFFNL